MAILPRPSSRGTHGNQPALIGKSLPVPEDFLGDPQVLRGAAPGLNSDPDGSRPGSR